MAIQEIKLPLGGYSEGLDPKMQQQGTCGYMKNVRPRDVLEGKLRLGQRPGLKKSYNQVGDGAFPIVWLGSITVVD